MCPLQEVCPLQPQLSALLAAIQMQGDQGPRKQALVEGAPEDGSSKLDADLRVLLSPCGAVVSIRVWPGPPAAVPGDPDTMQASHTALVCAECSHPCACSRCLIEFIP